MYLLGTWTGSLLAVPGCKAPSFAVDILCAHASGSVVHVLGHALLHTSTPSAIAAYVYSSQAHITLPKLGHQHVDLTDGIVPADTCGLMLTVKGMFTHTLWRKDTTGMQCLLITAITDAPRCLITHAPRSLMQTS